MPCRLRLRNGIADRGVNEAEPRKQCVPTKALRSQQSLGTRKQETCGNEKLGNDKVLHCISFGLKLGGSMIEPLSVARNPENRGARQRDLLWYVLNKLHAYTE